MFGICIWHLADYETKRLWIKESFESDKDSAPHRTRRRHWPARWAIWTQTAILRCSSGQRPVILFDSIPPSDLMNWLSNRTSCSVMKQKRRGSKPDTINSWHAFCVGCLRLLSLWPSRRTYRVVVFVLQIPSVDGTLGCRVWGLGCCWNVRYLSLNLTDSDQIGFSSGQLDINAARE